MDSTSTRANYNYALKFIEIRRYESPTASNEPSVILNDRRNQDAIRNVYIPGRSDETHGYRCIRYPCNITHGQPRCISPRLTSLQLNSER